MRMARDAWNMLVVGAVTLGAPMLMVVVVVGIYAGPPVFILVCAGLMLQYLGVF